MQWIKSHLMIVIVGSISALSLTGLVLGYVMSPVSADLEADSRELSRLQAIKPVNPRIIDATRKQQQEDATLLEEYFRKYQEAKQYKPLDDMVFADNITDSQRQAAIFRFQDKYLTQPKALLQLLKAKDQPTADEFTEYERETRAKQEKIEKELGTGVGGMVTPAPSPLAPAARAPNLVGPATAEQDASRSLRTAYAVARAKEIYCYASEEESLDYRIAEVKPTGGATPPIEDLWHAQVALWVQEDVFRALGGLNEAVAGELPDEARWVAHLPVKRLIRFTMGNYVPRAAAGEDATGGFGPPAGGMLGGGARSASDLLTAGPNAVFTKRLSSETVDVVRFRLELVVDARRLLHVLDAISKAGFYTPLTVDLNEVVMAQDEHYIYGSAPVVQMVATCEGSFLRSSYDKIMPQSVKQAITEGRAGGLGKGASVIGGIRMPGGSVPGIRGGPPRGGRGEYREDYERESLPRRGGRN